LSSAGGRAARASETAFSTAPRSSYAPEERRWLLRLARRALMTEAVMEQLAKPEDIPARLKESKACFITLTKRGALRGCIGQVVARLPLYQAVIENTRNAASNDPRFPPVRPPELQQVRIEISVLTEPQALVFASPADLLGKLQPPDDGVLLQIGDRVATFLPQVWAHVPGKEQFLNQLAQKAGCQSSAWRGTGVTVSTYRAEHFQEDEPDCPL